MKIRIKGGVLKYGTTIDNVKTFVPGDVVDLGDDLESKRLISIGVAEPAELPPSPEVLKDLGK